MRTAGIMPEGQSFGERTSAEVVDTLPFIVSAEGDAGTMGLFSRDGLAELKHIPVVDIQANLLRVVNPLREMLSELAAKADGMPLKEAQIGLEISAEGGVQFVGTAKVGAKAAITLVFGR